MSQPLSPFDKLVSRVLPGNLVLRRATPDDRDATADFVGRWLNPGLGINVADLMSGRHPTTRADHFVIATRPDRVEIVSAAGLISLLWSYDGILVPVGNPEFVVTHPDYRGQGLMTAVMDMLHALSANLGHLAQAIGGVPWFYRRFGYEYALEREHGRTLRLSDAPPLSDDSASGLHIRRATPEDIPSLMRLYERQRQGKLVSAEVDEARWRYDLTMHSPGSDIKMRCHCIESHGQVVGYYRTFGDDNDVFGGFIVNEFGIAEGWQAGKLAAAVAEHIAGEGRALGAAGEDVPERITFSLGSTHPVYEALGRRLDVSERPGAWYVRVADAPDLLLHIAPALERRLETSVLPGFSGALALNFYQDGLHLRFERGKLVDAAATPRHGTDEEAADAAFPPCVFLKLLFGYRSLAQILDAYPDASAKEQTALLLNILFPKMPSWIVFQG